MGSAEALVSEGRPLCPPIHTLCKEALWRASRAFSILVALGGGKGALRLEEGCGPRVLRLEK